MNMTRLSLCAVALCACNAASPRSSDQNPKTSELTTAITDLPVVKTSRQKRSEQQVASTLSALADALGPSIASSAAIRLSHSRIVAPTSNITNERWDATIDADAKLYGRYESNNDGFEVFDNGLNPSVPFVNDIGRDTATTVFSTTYGRLVAGRLIDPARVRKEDVVVREAHAAEGDQNGVRRSWIEEFLFFIPLNVDGVRIGTDTVEYGVSINVHRTGKVRRIELTGAGIGSSEAAAASVTRTVRKAERATAPHDAIRATIGASEIHPLGLRFVVDEDADGGELIARELFRVVPTGTGPEGEVVRGKAYVASYSADSADDALSFSPPPGSYGPPSANSVKSK